MSNQIKKLHEVYHEATGSKVEDPEANISPLLAKRLKEPHLSVMVGANEWMPIVPGMILALVTDRSKVDGIAPFIITKVCTKPGKEYIDLVAWTTNVASRRKLRLGAKYSGHFASAINNTDQVVDAASAALKGKPDGT